MPALSQSPTIQKISFEHPGNEQMRLYLRLEYLFDELEKQLQQHTKSANKQAMATLLKLLNVSDRPDLKSKLVQQLTLHMTHLTGLISTPHVDPKRLTTVLQQLKDRIDFLNEHNGKMGKEIRNHAFLNQIKLHLTNPAGICPQSLPAYKLWLTQDIEKCIDDLRGWCQPFLGLNAVIHLLLKLTRQSAHPEQVIAHHGNYQKKQNANQPCSLICVTLPEDSTIFPEISANKHRVNIQFLEPDIKGGSKPKPVNSDVSFELLCN